MPSPFASSSAPRFFILAAALALSACAAQQGGTHTGPDIHDPFEPRNRQVHAFNVAVDKALFEGAGDTLPEPVTRAVSNMGDNLGLPGKVVNSLLQGRPEPALRNSFRFLINSTLGLGGMFDPAGADFALPEIDTDFGETLHVWGATEGAYLELPFFGPSTERDFAGKVVDALIDPLNFTLGETESDVATGVNIASKVSDRLRYGDAVDSILHESADSYAQMRLLYLQNRRFELGMESEAEAYDPYEDPYGQ